MKRFTTASAFLLMTACATGPGFETEGVNTALEPDKVTQAGAEALVGQRVIWGGVLIASRNLEQVSELEVLGYPLDEHNQKPQLDERPLSRFLVRRSGYLETADYGQGRLVTVTGRFIGVSEGRVGEARYLYPVVDARQIYLWEPDYRSPTPRIHFGVGVVFGN